MYYKAYRYRLYPTKAQEQLLAQHFGAVRFVYNWALETKKKAWEEGKENVSRFTLSKQITAVKAEKDWLNGPDRKSIEAALQHLEQAYIGFFKGKGYPQYKSKRERQAIFYGQNPLKPSMVRFGQHQIRIPKVGFIKAAISQPFNGQLKSITVSKTPTGKYYAACVVALEEELPTKSPANQLQAVGIDLGIKSFAVLSTGEVIGNPKFLTKSLKALRRGQSRHSKKKKGGKNREKSRMKLARIHEKITYQRNDFLHKVTTKIIRENQAGTLCIEDLNVAAIGRNRKLSLHVSDAGWGTFRQYLTYKADWYGVNLRVIDRFAPSSRMCSCGTKNTELTLKQRTWTCAACGTTHDRDLLAAQNIVRFAFQSEPV